MIKANVNDWVIFSTGREKQVRKVTHVDAKGRLYFRPSKDWRDGYEPETGHSRNSKGRIERLATKEEIREHLRVEEQKAEDRRRAAGLARIRAATKARWARWRAQK